MSEFKKPDADTIKRMTPVTLRNLIGTLKQKRSEIVEPLDTQIKYYEDLLQQKESATHG